MKVCYFFSNIHLGETTGQSGMALCMIKKAQELGYEVYVISNYENQQNDLGTVDTGRAERFLISGPSTLKTYVLNSCKIIRHLREVRPDIIHVQGHLLIPYVYFLNKMVKCGIIYTLPERIDYLNRLLQYLVVYCIKNINIGFVVSQYLREQLVRLGAPADRILVSRIGLRSSFLVARQKKQEYEHDIFYYGDASQERGFDFVCRSAKMLPHRKFRLLVRWKKDGKRNLKELQKLDNVFVDTSCLKESELRQLILRSKLVVLPYRWMGVQPPITLLEAMALGKCVLTTALPGCKNLLVNDKNVVLIDPDDSLKKSVTKIEFLLGNMEVVEKIGKDARETILKSYSLLEYKRIFLAYEMIVNNFYEWRMFGNLGNYFVSTKEINNLLDLLQPRGSNNILDVGTGSGRFARAIIKSSKAKVTGLDPDQKILKEGEKLRKLFFSREEDNRYKCVFGNGHNIPFANDEFDKVFCFRVLKYYQDPWCGIDELTRVLKPGGNLVVEVISNRSWESIASYFLPKVARDNYTHFWEKNMRPFNLSEVKKYLLSKNMIVTDERALHKIPPFLYSKFGNRNFINLLDVLDKILLKTTPKCFFSKSIVLKCKKL